MLKNKYGTVKELRSTFSHIQSINIDFSNITQKKENDM